MVFIFIFNTFREDYFKFGGSIKEDYSIDPIIDRTPYIDELQEQQNIILQNKAKYNQVIDKIVLL